GDPACGPNCERCRRFVELWNLVFMEYNRKIDGSYEKLPQRNVDTGIGFERLVALLENKDSAYETDLLLPIIEKLAEISGRNYKDDKKEFRIIADHIRGSVFLISDGVLPSNVGEGYILRRILRRAIRYGKLLDLPQNFLIPLAQKVIENYQDVYHEVKSKENDILTIIQREEGKFEKTLEKGMGVLKRIYGKIIGGVDPEDLPKRMVIRDNTIRVDGQEVFRIYETYGFPPELSQEIMTEWGLRFDDQTMKECKEAFKKHQEVSRAGAEKKFGGIGKEANYTTVKLHTATHLLHQALREVLGSHIRQMGSDITAERLRFDFSHSQKMTEEEIKKIEDLVNQKIKEDLEVKKEEMTYQKALDIRALAFFKERYPQEVTVYSVNSFSKEICAGPHAKRTSELGSFKIIKEESSGAGVRRIRAILE
ncbi:alanine--tRNA ligase, partial [Patescibacteria group bacterium]|nr:alanine--tRNA ligase [Patescibacteria group bacterium]